MMFDYNYCIYQAGTFNLSHIEDWCQTRGLKNAPFDEKKGKFICLNSPHQPEI